MTRTPLRVAVCLAVLFVGTAGQTTAADTLGATIQSRVYLSEGRSLAVLNRSTIPVRFSVEPVGDLVAEPADGLILAPDETGTFTVSGTAHGQVRMVVRVSQLRQSETGETTALAFDVLVADERPPDYTGPAAVLLLLVLAAGALLYQRRRRDAPAR